MYEKKNYYYDPSGGYYTSMSGRGQTDSGNSSSFSSGPSNEQSGGPYSGQNVSSDMNSAPRRSRPRKTKQPKVIEWTKTKLACLLLAVLLLAGGGGYAGSMLAAGQNNVTPSASSQSESAQSGSSESFDLASATGSKMTVQQISKSVSDSVVEIRTESVSQGMWIQEYVTEGAGSGVVISEDGYIVTNNHVISGASKIYVTLDDSDKEYTAKLIGTDSANDIAVLKIDAEGLTPAKLGDSDKVTAGDISSTARKITLENQEMTLMQTDASINPGNSGGGMFDGSGQLIGIVVAKSSGTGIEGLGFAIPVNTVSKAVDNIMNGGGDDTSSTQEEQNSQNSQDQYGSGQDQYGGGQDPFSQDPFSQDPFGGSDIFEFFGF